MLPLLLCLLPSVETNSASTNDTGATFVVTVTEFDVLRSELADDFLIEFETSDNRPEAVCRVVSLDAAIATRKQLESAENGRVSRPDKLLLTDDSRAVWKHGFDRRFKISVDSDESKAKHTDLFQGTSIAIELDDTAVPRLQIDGTLVRLLKVETFTVVSKNAEPQKVKQPLVERVGAGCELVLKGADAAIFAVAERETIHGAILVSRKASE